MAKRARFDARKLMELAVSIMRHSVHEPRTDDKASPLVGAVLRKPDGTVETACRGELRHGDHAEFTLLERKNRNTRLDGSVMFATLEPCAKGSRRHPKICCAERIVLARIKEVWVGIEDPDPSVAGKGMQFLKEHGIEVHLFDRDLQDIIKKENRKFLEQAVERATAAVEKRPEALVLSPLESPAVGAELKDFADGALEQFRHVAGITEGVKTIEFRRKLVQQGVLKEEGTTFKPTGFGLLLFGKHPRDAMPQAGMLGTIHYPNGRMETQDFDGPMVLIPERVEKWLADKLPNTIDRSQMRRKSSRDVPAELIREGVVNALVHRDYDIKGAKCQLEVTPDTIVIRSPGKPREPITIEQLQSFSAPMLSRNPQLHYVFARMDLAEERGLGMKTFADVASSRGLPRPTFRFEDPYLVLTLYRSMQSAASRLSPRAMKALNKDERTGWEILASAGSMSVADYSSRLGIDRRTAQRHFKRFVELGLLKRTGRGRATGYTVVG